MSNYNSLQRKNLKQYRKKEKLQALMKYLLNYGRQENLTVFFFNYAMLYINKAQLRNG